MKRPRIWPVLVASAIGFAVLCCLGIWQLQRLAWKEGLIAELNQKMLAQPVTLKEAMLRRDAKQNVDYLRVRTSGHYLQQLPLRRMSVHQSGPGFELLQAFMSDDGIFILVNRGTISTDDQQPAEIPNTTLILEGLARTHSLGKGLFDGRNDAAANLWLWWDLPAMLTASAPPANGVVAPFILQLVPASTLNAKPLVATPKAELRNNHLGYAITWFGLAAALLAVTGVFVFRLRK